MNIFGTKHGIRAKRRGVASRTVAMLLAASAICSLGALPVTAAHAADPVVQTKAGKLRGLTRDGVAVFRGIPYGQTTAGENRFMPPKPFAAWQGVRDAKKYGLMCPQASTQGMVGSPQLAAIFGLNPNEPEPDRGDDCLMLNVWTPEANMQHKRPVLVWFHGGGFAAGAGTMKDDSSTDGFALAKKHDVVVVSINHRLGSFGYLHLGDIAGEKFATSGTVGMQDLVLSLQWVRDNIAQFGGDPKDVMIFGESGGGSKVSAMLAMPSGKGLFNTAIIESGPGLRMMDRAEASQTTEKLLTRLNLKPNQVSELQALPWEKLVEAQGSMMGGLHLIPVVDGKVLPQHPFLPKAAPTAAGIPLIIGATKDETNTFLIGDPQYGKFTEEEARKRLPLMLRAFGATDAGSLDALVAAYKAEYPSITPTDLLVRVLSDQTMAHSLILADRKAEGSSAPVYVYRFAYETDVMDGKLGSPHGIDIPFNFDVTEIATIAGSRPEKTQVANQLVTSFITFAKNGNPNNALIPHWDAHKPGANQAMWIDKEWKMAPALPTRIYDAWRVFLKEPAVSSKS